jgi:(2R)-phospho-3-sulfolactate synthase (ComA)
MSVSRMNNLRIFARPQLHRSRLTTSLQSRHPIRFLSSQVSQAQYLLQDKDNGFGFIRSNPRTPKPRKHGVTEVRGPYYSAYGKRHWQDVMDIMGHHVDGLKFAGGSFTLMPEKSVTELIDIAHQNDVYVSTVRSKNLHS